MSVTRSLAIAACLLAASLAACRCSPAERAGVPILSQVDAIGIGLSRVLGWCEGHRVDGPTLERARRAAADKDYGQALALTADLVAAARAAGDPVPEDVEVTLRLAEGAVAAHAVEVGMRALSTPAASAAPPPSASP
jgi:hypothetical protein